jgi:hypothetical protein
VGTTAGLGLGSGKKTGAGTLGEPKTGLVSTGVLGRVSTPGGNWVSLAIVVLTIGVFVMLAVGMLVVLSG